MQNILIFFILIITVIGVCMTDDVYATNLNLRADVDGTSITFEWNGVLDKKNSDAYYALSPNSNGEIQLNSNVTSFVTNEMYGEPGDRVTWVLEARISNDSYYSVIATHSRTVTVPENYAPTVNAGRDQSTTVGRNVTLSGHASDRNGDDLEFIWSQISGPAILFNNDEFLDTVGYSQTVKFQAPPAPDGTVTLVFNLTATDSILSSTDSVTVTVRPTGPVADAGTSRPVIISTTTVLDGSGSYDVDGGDLTYEWMQVLGTVVNIDNSTMAVTNFVTPNITSALKFKLTVTDEAGLSDSDYLTIRSTNSSPPDADAGPDVFSAYGHTIYINGSASSDPDNDYLSYRWTQVSGDPVKLSNAGRDIASFRVSSSSNYSETFIFKLTVTDSVGFTDTDTVYTMLGPNVPPRVEVTGFITKPTNYLTIQPNPNADDTIPRGATYKLFVSYVQDEDADNLRFSWRQTDGPSVSLRTSGDTATFSTSHIQKSSILEFNLTARDSFGLYGSDVYKVFVNVVDPVIPQQPPPSLTPEIDTTAPYIIQNGNIVYVTKGDTYRDPGATCVDETDGTWPAPIWYIDVDTSKQGWYVVVYDCEDNAGNSKGSGMVRNVWVDDPAFCDQSSENC